MFYKHKYVYVLGDIHGEFWHLLKFIQDLPEDSLLIQVGDFGVGYRIGYENSILESDINPLLQKKNITLIAIRGNHDNPACFDGQKYSNIFLVPDYTYLQNQDITYLLIGGAISVDRKYNVSGKSYWPDERLCLDPNKITGQKVDVLITHTTNNTFNPYGGSFKNIMHFINNDHALYSDLRQEQETVDKLYNLIKPEKWYFGHFHNSFSYNNGTTIGRCLDINEIVEII